MTRSARNKYTYIVLGVLIVALSLYLVLRQRDRMQYAVPELSSLNAREIEALEIEKTGGVVKMIRSGETWQIQPEGYRVDPAAIGEMLKTAADLQLSELVSVTGNYGRYGLDQESRIRVTVFKNDKALRSFDLGKRSPTYSHTFIRINEDDRVFQIPKNPGAVFGLSKEDLRDRVVLSFDPDMITDIRAQGAGWTVTLIKMGVAWSTKTGEPWETEKIDELLNTLSDLKAFRYREQEESDGNPVFSITLTGKKPYTIKVFARQDNAYPARSSENAYPFALFYAVTENIINIFAENR
jgi:hypothetical protein